MTRLPRHFRRFCLLAAMTLVTLPSSGCKLAYWFAKDAWYAAVHFGTTPLIPVTPYFSQKVEDQYWHEERYGRVPILDPIEGENAPLFCLDPPTPDHVVRSLPDPRPGGVPFLAETQWNNMKFVVTPIVDEVSECRFFPMAGPARLHKCHYKCTVFFEETKRSHWPVPFTFTEQREEVVYIDKNHLIRCAGPVNQIGQ